VSCSVYYYKQFLKEFYSTILVVQEGLQRKLASNLPQLVKELGMRDEYKIAEG